MLNPTNAQLLTIKSWVVANFGSVFSQDTVAALNAIANPAYRILKERVNLTLVMANGYDWTIVDNETVGQSRIFDRMLQLDAVLANAGLIGIEPWKITILKGIGEAYKGSSPAAIVPHRRNILQNHFTRSCRVWEKLFVVATSDWNVASNSDMTGARGLITNPDSMPFDASGNYFAGDMTIQNVIDAQNAV